MTDDDVLYFYCWNGAFTCNGSNMASLVKMIILWSMYLISYVLGILGIKVTEIPPDQKLYSGVDVTILCQIPDWCPKHHHIMIC